MTREGSSQAQVKNGFDVDNSGIRAIPSRETWLESSPNIN